MTEIPLLRPFCFIRFSVILGFIFREKLRGNAPKPFRHYIECMDDIIKNSTHQHLTSEEINRRKYRDAAIFKHRQLRPISLISWPDWRDNSTKNEPNLLNKSLFCLAAPKSTFLRQVDRTLLLEGAYFVLVHLASRRKRTFPKHTHSRYEYWK